MMMTMMMKLPILQCAEKLETYTSLLHPKHELKPTRTVRIIVTDRQAAGRQTDGRTDVILMA